MTDGYRDWKSNTKTGLNKTTGTLSKIIWEAPKQKGCTLERIDCQLVFLRLRETDTRVFW